MSEPEDRRIQLNVTVKEQTIEQLQDIFPDALDDSERVRRAIAESIERSEAATYTISQA